MIQVALFVTVFFVVLALGNYYFHMVIVPILKKNRRYEEQERIRKK